MGRKKSDNPREILSLSLPEDMLKDLDQRARTTGLSRSQIVRNAMTIGLTVQDDPATLARAVRHVYQEPAAYNISTRIALREAIERLLDAGQVGTFSALKHDLQTLEGYVDNIGPYEAKPGVWVAGPFTDKVHGEDWQIQVGSDQEATSRAVTVRLHLVNLRPHPLELEGKLYWVYTNAQMTPSSVRVFQENIIRHWMARAQNG
jgi:hypothetical protein